MSDAPTDDRPRASGLRRAGVAAVVASFVGIWGYVLYLSIFEGRPEPRDRMEDTAFASAAEETCADTRAVIATLPLANQVQTPEERAALLDATTDELETMVDRLAGLVAPADAAEARAVSAWLEDWRTHLEDRRAYAEVFRAGQDRPFRATDRGGFQIDVLIDDFARVNFMESCETPEDVG